MGAGAVVAIGAAIAGGAASSYAVAAGVGVIAAGIIGSVVTTGVSYLAVSALGLDGQQQQQQQRNTPDASSLPGSYDSAYLLNATNTAAPIPVVYGKRIVGGPLVWYDVLKENQLSMVTCVSIGPIIVGSGTEWLSHVVPGDLFGLASNTVTYVVGTVESNTRLVLTQPYLGITESGAAYGITRDFTPINEIPYPNQGDIQTASIVQRALLKIDGLINLLGEAFTIRGDWLTSTAYSVNDLVIYEATGDFTGNIYRCVSAHTSTSSFENDLAAGKWVIYIDNETINFAQKWASNPEDVEVQNGLYSALHYAVKSGDSSTLAQASAAAAALSEAAAAQSEQNVTAKELEINTVVDRFVNELDELEQNVNYVEYTALATSQAEPLTAGDFTNQSLDLGDDGVSGEWLYLEQIPMDQRDLSLGSGILDLENDL